MNYDNLLNKMQRVIGDAVQQAWNSGLRESDITNIVNMHLIQLRRADTFGIVPVIDYGAKQSEPFLAFNMYDQNWFETDESKVVELRREMSAQSGWVFVPLFAFTNVEEAVAALTDGSLVIKNVQYPRTE